MKTPRVDRPQAWRRIALAPLLAAALWATPGWAMDLPALAALLTQRTQAQASFSEERVISGLDQPLVSSGTLLFVAPQRLERHTLQPRAESMLVDGTQLTLIRGGRSRQMSLEAVPEMIPLIEALRATLSGELARLQDHFSVKLEGSTRQWKLMLVPRDSRLRLQVLQIDISGQESALSSIEMRLAGGDRSTMTLGPPLAAAPRAASK